MYIKAVLELPITKEVMGKQTDLEIKMFELWYDYFCIEPHPDDSSKIFVEFHQELDQKYERGFIAVDIEGTQDVVKKAVTTILGIEIPDPMITIETDEDIYNE